MLFGTSKRNSSETHVLPDSGPLMLVSLRPRRNSLMATTASTTTTVAPKPSQGRRHSSVMKSGSSRNILGNNKKSRRNSMIESCFGKSLSARSFTVQSNNLMLGDASDEYNPASFRSLPSPPTYGKLRSHFGGSSSITKAFSSHDLNDVFNIMAADYQRIMKIQDDWQMTKHNASAIEIGTDLVNKMIDIDASCQEKMRLDGCCLNSTSHRFTDLCEQVVSILDGIISVMGPGCEQDDLDCLLNRFEQEGIDARLLSKVLPACINDLNGGCFPSTINIPTPEKERSDGWYEIVGKVLIIPHNNT